MKKKITSVLKVSAFIILQVIVSCTKKESSFNPEAPSLGISKDSITNLMDYLIRTLDVKKSEIYYDQSRKLFIVQGDMEFSKEDLENSVKSEIKKSKSPSVSQRVGPYTVSSSYIGYIRVKVSCTTPAWITASKQAIKNWNLHPIIALTAVRFIEVTGSSAYDINIYETGTTASDNTWIASAPAPNSTRRPGPTVSIYNNHPNETPEKKAHVITHELGHTIGLKHTDGVEGTRIPGTAPSDTYSLMNNGGGNVNRFLGFSNNDLIALRYLYAKTTSAWENLTSLDRLSSVYFGSDGFMYVSQNPTAAAQNIGVYDRNIYKYVNGTYISVAIGMQCAVLPNGEIWTIDYYNRIRRYVNGTSTIIPGNNATRVAAGRDGSVYILTNTLQTSTFGGGYTIKKWDGSAFQPYAPLLGATDIAVHPDGALWAVKNNGDAGRIAADPNFFGGYSFSNYNTLTDARSIAIGGDGTVLVTTNTDGYEVPGGFVVRLFTGWDWYVMPFTAFYLSLDLQGHPYTSTAGGGANPIINPIRNLSL